MARQMTTMEQPLSFSPRVLLVEDDPGNLTFLKLLLESADCVFAIAQTGGEALELLAEDSFDLILLDLHLPDMDGYAFCQCARENNALKSARIVGISAEADAGQRKKCIEAGMKALYSKTLDIDGLNGIFITHAA